MRSNSKHYFLSFLVILIFIISFFAPVPIYSFSINPVSFIQSVIGTVVIRVSDIIHYLIMQKRYSLDDYSDPNVYPEVNIPEEVEQIISSTTNQTISKQLADIVTPTIPNVEEVNNVSQVVPAVPILVSKPNLIVKNSIVGESEINLEILEYTNIERQKYLIDNLSPNLVLDKIAELRIDDLFTNQYFEHVSPNGKSAASLAKINGYDYYLIGENLALGEFGGSQGIVSAWMESLGHRENILNEKYKELGVAVKKGIFNGEETLIAVQIFATPLFSVCPKPKQESVDLINSLTITIGEMRNKAQIMYNNLIALKDIPEIDRAYYNQKLQEYNYYVKSINETISFVRGLIDLYNVEINKYNTCISI